MKAEGMSRRRLMGRRQVWQANTIKPGAYPAGLNLVRPPHIHFAVTGKSNRLVTQMYFAGEV